MIQQKTERAQRTAATWRTIPVLEALDRHEESFHAELQAPGGLKVLAARVRGRQHRHEGRNCDDWLEIAQAGEWTIVAVADGAGSRPLSRVGAKVSCRAAAEKLARQLVNIKSHEKETTEQGGHSSIARCLGLEVCMRLVRSIHLALKAAFTAVEQASAERVFRSEYRGMLGRMPAVEDFAATLSLLVFKVVTVDGVRLAVGWGYQIGDGFSAGIDPLGAAQVIGRRDQGEFANETLFLSREYLNGVDVNRRISKILCPLNVLAAMTDGVTEPQHFPLPDRAGAEVLYADMVLNNVVPAPIINEAEIASALAGTKISSLAEFMQDARFHHPVDMTKAGKVQTIAFADSELLAEYLGVTQAAITASPAILAIGARRTAMLHPASPSSEWLETWLESFPWKSCYDDRTLVVAFEEGK